MQVQAEDRKGEVIKKVVIQLRAKPSRKRIDGVEAFIRHFYGEVPPVDIADEPVEDPCGTGLSIREFAENACQTKRRCAPTTPAKRIMAGMRVTR
jgi:hypothetical protein